MGQLFTSEKAALDREHWVMKNWEPGAVGMHQNIEERVWEAMTGTFTTNEMCS